ncbi:MAG: 23S rRNA (uracil(1939)-C(5))-methyltransferase RlmD, partial [Acidaminobacteraceae bacterium]
MKNDKASSFKAKNKKKSTTKKSNAGGRAANQKLMFDKDGVPIKKQTFAKPVKEKKAPARKMEHIREKCVGLTTDAKGVVMFNGKELLVPHILEGEKALIEVRNSGKFSSRKVVSLMTKSDSRVEPECPYYYDCGGCQLQHMDYQAQLKFKENVVTKLLKKYGKVDKIISMDEPYDYRNKAHATYASYENNEVTSGIYEEYSHKVVSIDRCIIQNPASDAIFNTVKKLAKKYKLRIYNEDTENGFLRHTLIRNANATGEIMVVIVVTEKTFPSKAKFMSELLQAHPEITTIVQSINSKKTTMVLGDKEIIAHGNGYIEDIQCGLRFRLSPKSFY